jgi:hypothetical protein
MENENKVLTRMSRFKRKREMNRRVDSTNLQNDVMDRRCSRHGIDEKYLCFPA